MSGRWYAKQKCSRESVEEGNLDLVRLGTLKTLWRTLENSGLEGELSLQASPRMRYFDYMGREVSEQSDWVNAEYSLWLDLPEEKGKAL